ncbi:UNVERIFIED_CONTAM: hypothetical protein Sangu_2757600 [Sesamum angustifolium]|uniref:CCHC-type domain-containing protein n=1 Tax=Sesamum angustifolium TaxID=2727405 RepID=A0AAW2IUM1_9LAMI
MDSDLGGLGSLLSFIEEEESGLVVLTGLWHAETLSLGFFVVGRLLSSTSFHLEALHSTLKAAFNPGSEMEFKLIGGIIFCLNFSIRWIGIVCLKDASNDLVSVDLNWCEFHIHIYGCFLGKMTKEVASFIRNGLGKFKEVDLDKNGEVWVSSVHIRVALDITKPVKRALKICTVLGDEQLVSFTYERLLNVCYFCGCLGHLSHQCEVQFRDGFQ